MRKLLLSFVIVLAFCFNVSGQARFEETFVTDATTGETATPANIGIHIAVGGGQTQQAIYTIPDGKTGYFIKGYVALQNANKNGEDGTFQWLLRLNNGLNGAWLVKGEIGLINIADSSWQYEYGIPAGPIPEHTDIKIKMSYASATMATQAGYDILLVDN